MLIMDVRRLYISPRIGSRIFRIDSLFAETIFKIKVKVLAFNVLMVPAIAVGLLVTYKEASKVAEHLEGIGSQFGRSCCSVKITVVFFHFRRGPDKKWDLRIFSILL